MKLSEVKAGMTLTYSGGPIVGGWFTVISTVTVLAVSNTRVAVRHIDGATPGKEAWVSSSHLTATQIPDHGSN